MGSSPPDLLTAVLRDAGGLGARVSDLHGTTDAAAGAGPGQVRIGVRRGALEAPAEDLDQFDVLLCDDPAASAPWVGVRPAALDGLVSALQAAIEAQPLAAAVIAQVLRVSLKLDFAGALASESLAYSVLLASTPFRSWRAATPIRVAGDASDARIQMTRTADGLSITLSRPLRRNAFDSRMRDALCEALQFAIDDPEAAPVLLSGQGLVFSAGGDMDEFGAAQDVGLAHLIRTLRAPAALVHALSDRATARVHGACIGAGVEIPAAAGHVIADPQTIFRLPEIGMGLLPAAGGTVTIPRRIGRHRTCWMALTGADVDARTAFAWGLVDALDPT